VYDPQYPDRPAQDRRAAIPPEPSRQDALGRLMRERWHAQQAGELGRVADIDREIERLSAHNAPTAPVRETTSATAPTREATAAHRRPARKK